MKVAWKDNQIDNESLQPYLNTFGDKFYEQIVRLIDNAMATDYIYNKLHYEEFVASSHCESVKDKLKRISEKISSTKHETQVNKQELKLKEVSSNLRRLAHGIKIIILQH